MAADSVASGICCQHSHLPSLVSRAPSEHHSVSSQALRTCTQAICCLVNVFISDFCPHSRGQERRHVLVIHCCLTKCHPLGSLKQHSHDLAVSVGQAPSLALLRSLG